MNNSTNLYYKKQLCQNLVLLSVTTLDINLFLFGHTEHCKAESKYSTLHTMENCYHCKHPTVTIQIKSYVNYISF